ncbi:MAG TPA: cation transporter [Vicinamibacterales bacterium]|nr:cation transporter [Vicinamibacterales bacterium]
MFYPNHARIGSSSLVVAALLFAVVGTACRREPEAASHTAVPQAAAEQSQTIRTVQIPVGGMICQVCAGTVKSALKKVDGVNEAEISLEKRSAVVHYDERKVRLEALTRAIKDAGFKPGDPSTPQSQ